MLMLHAQNHQNFQPPNCHRLENPAEDQYHVERVLEKKLCYILLKRLHLGCYCIRIPKLVLCVIGSA